MKNDRLAPGLVGVLLILSTSCGKEIADFKTGASGQALSTETSYEAYQDAEAQWNESEKNLNVLGITFEGETPVTLKLVQSAELGAVTDEALLQSRIESLQAFIVLAENYLDRYVTQYDVLDSSDLSTSDQSPDLQLDPKIQKLNLTRALLTELKK